MKKTLLAAALSAQLTTQLFAGGDIAPVEVQDNQKSWNMKQNQSSM